MKLSAQCTEWIEANCYVPEGKFVGQKLKLTVHEKKWLAMIYDSPTRTFILSMPRKNGKSLFSALLILLHLAGPVAKRNTQLYSAARSRDQAAIVFDLAAKIVRISPSLREHIGVRESAKELYFEHFGTKYKALSADVSTSFGKSPVFVVHDELGQVKGPRDALYEAMETGSAAHDEPLTVIISTQATTDGDLLSMLIDDAKTGSDKRVKVVLHAAPKSAKPFLKSTVEKCNPHFKDFMNQDEVMANAKKAKRIPSFEPAYRNLHLNQRVEAHNPFVSRSLWMANGAEPLGFGDRPIHLGLDLSGVNDLTALVAIAEDEGFWDVEPTFWLPGKGLADRAKSDRVPYDIWKREGFLQTTPGASIEYEFVAMKLREIFDENEVASVAFDRWGMRNLTPWLVKAGFSEHELEKFIPFGQGFKDMSPALRALESLLLNHKLRHGKHPVLTMCAANAVPVSDPAGNRKLAKNKSSGRIDGMVALAMAVGIAESTQEEEYEPIVMVI